MYTTFHRIGQINAAAGYVEHAVRDFTKLFELSWGNITAAEHLVSFSVQLSSHQMYSLVSSCLLPVSISPFI